MVYQEQIADCISKLLKHTKKLKHYLYSIAQMNNRSIKICKPRKNFPELSAFECRNCNLNVYKWFLDELSEQIEILKIDDPNALIKINSSSSFNGFTNLEFNFAGTRINITIAIND